MSIDKREKVNLKAKETNPLKGRPKPDINRPDISRLLSSEGIKNPLAEVDYGDGDIAGTDLGKVVKEEAGEMLLALKASEKADARRFQVATDSGFWFSVYFQNREQKEAFLTAMNWLLYGDKYLNGLQLADEQGIIIPNEVLPAKTRGAKRLTAIAEDLGRIKINK